MPRTAARHALIRVVLAVVAIASLGVVAAASAQARVPRDDARIVARIAPPGGAAHLAMGPKGRYLWTVASKANLLTPIEVADNSVATGTAIPPGLQSGVALATNGRTAYLSYSSKRMVAVVDLRSGRVNARIDVGRRPGGIAVSPDGRQVYVSCWGDQSVFVISTASNRVLAEIPVRGRPDALAFAPDGRRAYVASLSEDLVSVIDTRSRREVGMIASPSPNALAVSPDGTRLFVSSVVPDDRLFAIDTTSLVAVASLGLPDRPESLVVSPDSTRVYLAMKGLGVVDARSLSFLGTIPLDGKAMTHVAVGPDGTRAYATNAGRYVYVVDVAGYAGP
ncbi:MAG: hypothetical protein Q8M17_05200 [Actinomycetota bacterium]|nr:hypothetical protein [Actinomycetota bacterium]